MGNNDPNTPAFSRSAEERQKYVQGLVKQCLHADPEEGGVKTSDEDLKIIEKRTERKSLRKDQPNKETVVTTTATASSSGGGSVATTQSGNQSKKIPLWVLLTVGFIVIVLTEVFWHFRDIEKHSYNNTEAGKIELRMTECLITRCDEVQRQAVPPQTQLSTSTNARPSAVSNRQTMIARCGRNTEALTYKPDPGCFYFDNLSGSSEKTVGLWSRTSFHSIINEDDSKSNIVIMASDGSTCASSAADSCSWWLRQHLARDTDGFYKYSIRVPQGQGFISNLNVN